MNTIVGNSPWARAIRESIAPVAADDCTVLIEGPTGTGKELIARAIHARSRRCDGPLVVVDCASVAPGLFASELFGHVKGAYSGADGDAQGSFRAADGGTVFLDEIGELALDLQAQLLRAIQERAVTPVGDCHSIAVDVRVIAATNRDLRREVAAQCFREDLYYRLDVVKLAAAPLSERREDIAPLCRCFLLRRSVQSGLPLRRLLPEALQVLTACDWPGNVRHLQNVLERVCVLSGGGEITARQVRAALEADGAPAIATRIGIFAEDISSVLGVDASAVPVLRPGGPPGLPAALGSSRPGDCWAGCPTVGRGTWPTLAECEQCRIRAALERVDYNTSAAARRLGVDRRLLVRKARKYGLLPMRRHLRAA